MSEKEVDIIVDNLTHILPMLGKIFMRGVKNKTNYSPQMIHVMGALSHHGKLTMSGLGNHLSMAKPQVTTLVEKLVDDGLVERFNDVNDRRIVYIELTKKGFEKLAEIKSMTTESLRNSLEELDEKTLGKLKKGSTLMTNVLSKIVQKESVKEKNKGKKNK